MHAYLSKLGVWADKRTALRYFYEDGYDPQKMKESMRQRSPKLHALLQRIQQQDATDLETHKRLFKHFIYCETAHSLRVVASALVSRGWKVAPSATGGGERLAGLVVGADGCVGQTLMEEGERPTVTRPQRLESVFRSAEQPLADAEPHRRRRAPLGAGLEFPHR